MDDKTLYQHMDAVLSGVKIDKRLHRKLSAYRLAYISGSTHTIEFWSKPYIGTHRIYFTTALVFKFYTEVLGVSPPAIIEAVRNIPEALIPKKWKIVGDPLNLTMFYIINKALRSRIAKRDREGIAKEIVRIFNLRTIAAIHSNSFDMLTTQSIADAVYESLSLQFVLKKTGSWIAFIDYRADRALSVKQSVDKLTTLHEDDQAYIRIIGDIQSRPRRTFVIMYQRMLDIMKDNTAAAESSISETIADKEGVADVTTGVSVTIEKVISASSANSTFIRLDAIQVISGTITGMGEKDFQDMLELLRAISLENKKIHSWYRQCLVYLYGKIQEARLSEGEKKDPAFMMKFVKGILYAPRNKDADLIDIRIDGESLIKKLGPDYSDQHITRLRNGVIMYLYLLSRIL